MKKYNIVCVTHDYKTSIMGTYLSHRNALEALSIRISDEYKSIENQHFYKVYYESCNEITIYSLGLLYGKSLLCKYFIIEFEDSSEKIIKV